MSSLVFATGNASKFEIARAACEPLGLSLTQTALAIDEIQGEDGEVIARDKAKKAFALVGKPVVVCDNSWAIPGLNGFPGPYMKSVAHWLTAENFLNLTRPLKDRRIILIDLLAYCDSSEMRIFRQEFTAELLPDSRGSYGISIDKIVTMPGDNGLSIAEVYDRGIPATEREISQCWVDLATWYKERVNK